MPLGTRLHAQHSHVDVPFPTARLSSVARQALAVDRELSPLVRRDFSTVVTGTPDATATTNATATAAACVLRVHYRATTNRMLRVAVNSFMDSLALVLEVMEKLDADVLEAKLARPE